MEVLESCGGPIIARQQRTSLVQFTAELQQFTSNKDSHKDNGEAPLSVIAELGEVPEDLGSPVSSGLPLSVVRLKPLPVVGNRRPRNSGSTAVIAPVSEKLEVDDTPVYPKRGSDLSQGAATCMMSLLTTTSSGTNQVVRLSDSSGLRVSGGPSSVRKTPPAHYRSSLRATFDAHQALLKRMEKTQASIAQTARTKRLAAMMEQQEAITQSFVVRPDHYFRCTWDVCLALVVLYYNLTIPMRIMARFQCDPSDEALNSLYGADACLSRWDWSLLIDYLCDALLVADFVLRAQFFAFRRFEGEREIVEIDRQAIWCVFRPTFRCLVLAGVIFPIDLFAPLTGYLLVLRVTKLPSVLLLTTIIQDIQQWLDHERGVSISAEAITVTHLTLFTIISTCWMSVGWCIQHYGGAQSFSWVSAFYWCLTTMTTTGYGDITPADTSETIYNIVITIVGPTIFATIIAKFASYVKKQVVYVFNMLFLYFTNCADFCFMKQGGRLY